jgi:hypothetical protein
LFPEIQIPAEIVTAFQTVVTVLAVYFVAIWAGLVVWTFQDVRRRSSNWAGQTLAVLLVLVFSLPGLLLYFLLRPSETLAARYERSLEEAAILHELEQQRNCPSCKRPIEQDFVVCPHCTTRLKQACAGCGRALLLQWKACPYCAQPVAQFVPPDAVGAPAGAAGVETGRA